jgi:hypothetical protein
MFLYLALDRLRHRRTELLCEMSDWQIRGQKSHLIKARKMKTRREKKYWKKRECRERVPVSHYGQKVVCISHIFYLLMYHTTDLASSISHRRYVSAGRTFISHTQFSPSNDAAGNPTLREKQSYSFLGHRALLEQFES